MSVPKNGVIAALWTPTKDADSLDETALLSNVQFLKDKGVHGFMVLGSTGEFARLDLKTRLHCLDLLRAIAETHPTMVNTSAIRPADVIAVGKHARKLGFSSMALLPPPFYKLANADLAEFFVYCAKEVELPLFLYNFPERTGMRIEIETVASVADRVHLAGVKQSGADFEYHRELVELGRKKGFIVFSGAEVTLFEAMELGVAGCVSGLANAVPELVIGIYEAAQLKNRERAAEYKKRIGELLRLIDVFEFPLNVAVAMAARGLGIGEPKTPLSAETRVQFDRVLNKVRNLYESWGLTSTRCAS